MKRLKTFPNTKDGFTIIELMIATTILSTMLVMVTFIMINIGHLYYKGINQATTQDGVRNIVDTLSQDLKLSNGVVGGSVYNGSAAFCVGSIRYSYVIDKETEVQTRHALWRDTTTPGSCQALDLSVDPPKDSLGNPSLNGFELVPVLTRLTTLTISQATPTSPYKLEVGLAHGDANDSLPLGAGLNTRCVNNTQFCATASLSTIVVQRLQ